MAHRFVTGTISHESNTFSNEPTGLEYFEKQGITFGQEILTRFTGTGTVMGGFIAAAKDLDFTLLPTVSGSATPMGTVTREAHDYLVGNLLDGIRQAGAFDGVLLHLHGAMVADGIDDAEGRILADVRRLVGPDVPVVVALDLHGNITEEMVEHANALVGYDTYPHVDMFETGYRAAEILVRTLRDGLRPVTALAKPPMLVPLQAGITMLPTPLKRLIDHAKVAENRSGLVSASVFAGFPFADIPIAGLSAVVVADGDRALAQQAADEIAELAWDARSEFVVYPVPPSEAIRRAQARSDKTFVLADIADTGAGGTAGDGTVVLKALVDANAHNCAVAQIADREAVDRAVAAGVGSTVTMTIGGKQDHLHGDPIAVTGYVKLIHDGRYVCAGPMAHGTEVRMGRTVVLEIGGPNGIQVMLTSDRAHPADLNHFRCVGIEPTARNILVLKSAAHFRAAFTPIAHEIVEVDAPGICHPDLKRLTYHRVRRPIFPLDDF